MGQKDLPSAGQPGWHPHVAQAQLLVHEVEVVVQALVSRCQFPGRIYLRRQPDRVHSHCAERRLKLF
jgi:hypothetical protein